VKLNREDLLKAQKWSTRAVELEAMLPETPRYLQKHLVKMIEVNCLAAAAHLGEILEIGMDGEVEEDES